MAVTIIFKFLYINCTYIYVRFYNPLFLSYWLITKVIYIKDGKAGKTWKAVLKLTFKSYLPHNKTLNLACFWCGDAIFLSRVFSYQNSYPLKQISSKFKHLKPSNSISKTSTFTEDYFEVFQNLNTFRFLYMGASVIAI